MIYYIIKHTKKGFFLRFDEERAMPIFSREPGDAARFKSWGLARYERMRWVRSNKKQVSYVRCETE